LEEPVPRISADALSVVPVGALPFPPPEHLGEPEKGVFRDVVASADCGHFRHEDRELLALYCVQVVAARKLMTRKRRTELQQRELREISRMIITLSTKLRLGPKSRAPDNRRAMSAGSRQPGPRPWDAEQAAEVSDAPVDRRWT
jgi:phage terminase small subunit